MRYSILLVIVLVLSSAVHGDEATDFANWVKLNRSLVNNGQMKMSDFYIQMHDRVAGLKAIYDKSNMLNATSMQIRAAQEYEAGNITRTELNNRLREALAVWMKPGVSEPEAQSRPLPPINLFPNQINCTSTSMGTTTNTKCW